MVRAAEPDAVVIIKGVVQLAELPSTLSDLFVVEFDDQGERSGPRLSCEDLCGPRRMGMYVWRLSADPTWRGYGLSAGRL
jgi:hypothetical protein